MIPGLTTLIRFVAFIHGEPTRNQTNDPQHFGADVGGVGNGRVNLHQEPNA